MAAKAGSKYNRLCPMASYHHILYTVEKTGPNLQPVHSSSLGEMLTHPSSDVGACLPCFSISTLSSYSVPFALPSSAVFIFLLRPFFSIFPHFLCIISLLFFLQFSHFNLPILYFTIKTCNSFKNYFSKYKGSWKSKYIIEIRDLGFWIKTIFSLHSCIFLVYHYWPTLNGCWFIFISFMLIDISLLLGNLKQLSGLQHSTFQDDSNI